MIWRRDNLEPIRPYNVDWAAPRFGSGLMVRFDNNYCQVLLGDGPAIIDSKFGLKEDHVKKVSKKVSKKVAKKVTSKPASPPAASSTGAMKKGPLAEATGNVRIRLYMGKTINIGEYQSVRVDYGEEVNLGPDEDIAEAREALAERVKTHLAEQIDVAQATFAG